MLTAILTKPDLAEACFLIALILFVVAVILHLAKSTAVAYDRLIEFTGLAALALGFLAL